MAQGDTNQSQPTSPVNDAGTQRSLVPQFALDAADAKIATWSAAIVDAADTIERMVSSESLPVPDSVRDLASSTTQKLRNFGAQTGDYDAAELVGGLQRTAAAHPAASIGVGAAVGATLAALLVKLGSSGNAERSTASTTKA